MGGLRSFIDSAGVEWEVWEVVPRGMSLDAPERRQAERRTPAVAPRRPEQRYRERRLGLASALSGGWLVFRSATDRRRLVPVPSGWMELSERDLERYCRSAVSMSRPR